MNDMRIEGRPMKGGPREGSPVKGGPREGGPVKGSPMKGGPREGGPMKGSPVKGGPVKGGPMKGSPREGGPVKGGPREGGPETDARLAFDALRQRPAHIGRLLGYPDLTDELHGSWMREMIAGDGDFTLQAHRGSFKTTCLSIALAALLVTEPRKNILFLRKTEADVAEMLRQVERILRHEVFQRLTAAICGEPVRILRRSQTELVTDLYAAPRGAAQLLGIGLGGSLTGKHADIIVTDDIVNLKDRVSRPERERTRAIYMELQNIRNPGGRIINAGTPWHKDDAFSLMPRAEKFDCYRTGLLSREEIRLLKRRMSPSLFAANYELRHVAQEGLLFPDAPAEFAPQDAIFDGICHIDAAYGGGDFTALTCARRDGDAMFLYGRLWHGRVDQVLHEALDDCRRLMCAPMWLEMNADKGFLGREVRALGMPVRFYAETMNKHIKISSFLRKWWDRVVFVEGTDPEYIGQILEYQFDAAHDDAPDGAACVCRILDRRPGA